MKHHSKALGSDIAGKEDAVELTANPVAREMIGRMEEEGVEILLDRLEAQQPQCSYGLRGLCCRMCQWGPCRISDKSPKGVCGRDLESVVMANYLRSVAAGASAQTIHAHEMAMTLQKVARGEITLSVKSTRRLQEVGGYLNAGWSWTPNEELAEGSSQALLDDLGRMTDQPMTSLAFAPRERRKVWEELGVLPRSAAFEIVESMHMTTMGGCSDPQALFLQALRTGIAYAYSGLVASSVLSDILFGVPQPREAEVGFGVLKADHVNILVHGHSPVMLEKVLEKVGSEEIQALAREKGAAGIIVGGMCCTGHESLARHGIPTIAGVMGQELVLGTGAVDALVVDMQCVVPGIQAVAECYGTEIVTTCRSNRIPGATHIQFDAEHPETLDDDALRIAKIAIASFERRDPGKTVIPEHVFHVMTGFTRESIMSAFGGARQLNALLAEGKIRGIVAMVGCSNPKIPYETGHVRIARELVKEGVLVLTSGCSAHALLSSGLCSREAAADAAPGLRAACEEAGVPPVLVVGGCSDNTRIIQVFATLADQADLALPDLPFAASGPEFSNEKTMGQMTAVLAHGITTVVGLAPTLPIPARGPKIDAADAGSTPGSNPIAEFFGGDGLAELTGARLYIEPDPAAAAAKILEVLDAKREVVDYSHSTAVKL